MTSSTLFQNTSILRRSRVANFVDVIKILIIFIKTTFKGSNTVKTIRNYKLKWNFVFVDITKVADFR